MPMQFSIPGSADEGAHPEILKIRPLVLTSGRNGKGKDNELVSSIEYLSKIGVDVEMRFAALYYVARLGQLWPTHGHVDILRISSERSCLLTEFKLYVITQRGMEDRVA